ncbi:MAG: zonular occludens toxin domain-containing protein [Desulfuromonadales bacterium]|nr:zonular occludens toxin domain-containing protein [Desulfuromonadales bacterium]
MILLFIGLPGSGKTYEAVTKIVANLAKGREVFTNIEGLDDPDCRHVIQELCDLDDFTFENSLHFLEADQVSHFWEHITDGSFVLVDEVHKYWNSRDFQKTDNRLLSDWASTHRHSGNDVVMMTQKPEKLDSQVRSLAQWTHEFRKLNMFGRFVRNGYQVFIYEGEPSGKPLSTQFRSYNPKFFKAYKSYTNSDIQELGVVKAPNILNHWSVWCCLVAFVVFGVFFSKSSFSKGKIIDYNVTGSPSLKSVSPVPAPGAPGQTVVAEVVTPAAAPDQRQVVVSDTLWLPVSAYMKTSDGRQFLNVGNYRLSSWLALSDDNKLVQVKRSDVPQPIIDSAVSVALYR